MPRSHGRFHGQTRAPRRQTQWGIGPSAAEMSGSATESQIWSTGVVLGTTEAQATIVRLRGYLSLLQLTASAIGDGFIGAIGFGLVSTQAFLTGVGAVPTPFAEVGWPGWLFHTFFDIRQITSTEGDGQNALSSVFQLHIDSKAMRKWGEDMTLMAVIELIESGTGTWEMNAKTRVLLKLS